jgi:hypothetical protein
VVHIKLVKHIKLVVHINSVPIQSNPIRLHPFASVALELDWIMRKFLCWLDDMNYVADEKPALCNCICFLRLNWRLSFWLVLEFVLSIFPCVNCIFSIFFLSIILKKNSCLWRTLLVEQNEYFCLLNLFISRSQSCLSKTFLADQKLF